MRLIFFFVLRAAGGLRGKAILGEGGLVGAATLASGGLAAFENTLGEGDFAGAGLAAMSVGREGAAF